MQSIIKTPVAGTERKRTTDTQHTSQVISLETMLPHVLRCGFGVLIVHCFWASADVFYDGPPKMLSGFSVSRLWYQHGAEQTVRKVIKVSLSY